MPEKPTYDQIAEYAEKLTDKSKEQYGFCQRGKPGWGENMAFVGPMVNAFGGRWFDEQWVPQLTSEPWKTAVAYYVENMNKSGPPGATANGHNENRALFATGHCALWVDATSADLVAGGDEARAAALRAHLPLLVETLHAEGVLELRR